MYIHILKFIIYPKNVKITGEKSSFKVITSGFSRCAAAKAADNCLLNY